jgi:hypothetical protein
VLEHVDHGMVLGERVRREASEPRGACARCHLAQQRGRDAAVMPRVRDDERDLGLSRSRHAFIPTDPDDGAVVSGDECLTPEVVDAREVLDLAG